MADVVVLGAGFGGLTVATELDRRLGAAHRVTLVDERETFLMGLAKLWVLDGRRRPGEGLRRIADVTRGRRINFERTPVRAIDPAARTVRTGDGDLPYDHLVVALGARTAPEAVRGLPGAGHDLYSADGVAAFHRDLAAFSGGKVLVAVASMPFKCPPAPYEAAMLAKEFLERRGVAADVTVASPEPHPLPVAGRACGETVLSYLADRSVRALNGRTLAAVDGSRRIVTFADGSTEPYDLLAVVPPHRAPAVLSDAGLVGDAGYVPADAATLQTRDPRIHAVGDCNLVKLPTGKP
ncbi:MAG: NAD(P)/FAD-dependent oxidoreductase, partial [Methanobacteriota archaeon]